MISTPELRDSHARRRRRPRPSASWLAGKLGAGDLAGLRSMDAAADHRRRRGARASSRSARSTAACCRASSSTCSIAASRRRCRFSRASTAARSARCVRWRRRRRPMPRPTKAQIRARYARSGRRLPQALSRRATCAESMLRHDARCAVRLDRRTAGRQADRAGRAVLPLSTSITAIRRRTRQGCTPSTPASCPMSSARPTGRRRTGRRCRDTPPRRSSRMPCSSYWASFARDGRAKRSGAAAVAAVRHRARVHGFRRRAAAEDASAARACTSSTSRSCAGAAPRAASRGTGTSASPRRRCPPRRRNADDRRRDAGVRADSRQVPGARRQVASACRGGDGARGRPRRSHQLCRARRSAAGSDLGWCCEASACARGDRVATLAWNTQAHVEVWYAIMGMGAVCHTLNPRLTGAQLAAMVVQSEARVLVASADLAAAGAADRRARARRSNAWLSSTPRTSVVATRRARPIVCALEPLIAQARRRSDLGRVSTRPRRAACASPRAPPARRRASLTRIVRAYLHTLRMLQADVMAITARDSVLDGRADVSCQRLGPAVRGARGGREAGAAGPAHSTARAWRR